MNVNDKVKQDRNYGKSGNQQRIQWMSFFLSKSFHSFSTSSVRVECTTFNKNCQTLIFFSTIDGEVCELMFFESFEFSDEFGFVGKKIWFLFETKCSQFNVSFDLNEVNVL
jgi:hypothetical protein